MNEWLQAMAQDLTLYDLTIDEAVAELNKDNILTSNPDLESAVRMTVENARSKGIEDLSLVFLDKDPKSGSELYDFAREIIDAKGGTAIVRSPFEVGVASEDYSRAAISQGIEKMMGVPKDYPLGLNKLFDELQAYSVPWTLYSLIVGAIIIAIFVIMTAYWWNKGTSKPAD